jgi:dienelactone hydrolase
MPGRLLVVAVALTVAACRVPDAPAPLAPAVDAFTDQVETREVQLDDDFVTLRLHIPPTPEARKPVVIVTIGDRARLLRQGFVVATYRINWELHNPPAPPPEHAVGKWVLASPSADVLGQEYLRMIAVRANEAIPKIVDHLMTVPEIDPSRIGITGSSSNGFVALQATARDRRIAAAVVLSACGDYHHFLRWSSMGMDGAPLALEPRYAAWLRAEEVVRHPRRVLHAAVLMVNRNGDAVIPFGCADRTAAALTHAYEAAGVPERFRFVVIASDRHGLDERDAREADAWLDRWLRPVPPSGRPGA